MTANDILTAAFRAARVLKSPGTLPNANELAEALNVLNDLVDEWNARKAYSWAETFTAYTLTAGHQPHLIGPTATSPDFTTAGTRPVRIEGASIIWTATPTAVDIPLNIRDAAWWNEQRVKTLQSTIPTDLYYEPDVPNGSLYLWPIPSANYGLRLETWVTVGQFAATSSTVTAPPALVHALKLALAEELCVYHGLPVNPALAQKAQQARRAFESNNAPSPRIASADSGTGRARAGWNWLSGM
jgi:hypothetical protein